MAWLLHNLRKRWIPEMYVALISNMLTGWRNRLKFDDYILEWFQLDNGIVQGDPLSMVLYLFYSADTLDISYRWHKMCLGYVDYMALVATASSFGKTHWLLRSMLAWPEGIFS